MIRSRTTPPTPEDDRWAAAFEQPAEKRTVVRLPPKRSLEQTLYAVPRRFDIATLLVVSLAYSLMFSSMRLLNAPWQMFAFFGLLTVVVGVAQALFPYGNEPRWASMLAGLVYLQVWSVVGGVLMQNWTAGLCWIFASFLLGPPLGYFVGAIEAGVFLVADKVRKRWFPERDPEDNAATSAD